MTQSAVLRTGSTSYPGPSPSELGSLADWVSDTELADLQANFRPARAPSVAPASRPRHRLRPERYSGPTREELGSLGVWLDVPPSPPIRVASEPHPATAIHALESEIWVSETSVGLTLDSPAPRTAKASAGVASRPDPFLELLDELEAALQKRPRA